MKFPSANSHWNVRNNSWELSLSRHETMSPMFSVLILITFNLLNVFSALLSSRQLTDAAWELFPLSFKDSHLPLRFRILMSHLAYTSHELFSVFMTVVSADVNSIKTLSPSFSLRRFSPRRPRMRTMTIMNLLNRKARADHWNDDCLAFLSTICFDLMEKRVFESNRAGKSLFMTYCDA